MLRTQGRRQRMGRAAGEARGRARDAYDALRGRQHRRRAGWHWGRLAAAAGLGAAATWVATRTRRRSAGDSDPLDVPGPAKDFVHSGS